MDNIDLIKIAIVLGIIFGMMLIYADWNIGLGVLLLIIAGVLRFIVLPRYEKKKN